MDDLLSGTCQVVPLNLLNLAHPTCLDPAPAALSCLFLCPARSCCSLLLWFKEAQLPLKTFEIKVGLDQEGFSGFSASNTHTLLLLVTIKDSQRVTLNFHHQNTNPHCIVIVSNAKICPNFQRGLMGLFTTLEGSMVCTNTCILFIRFHFLLQTSEFFWPFGLVILDSENSIDSGGYSWCPFNKFTKY